MNLSERLRVDKELFSGERSSYENTVIYEIAEKKLNVSVGLLIYYGEKS